VGVKKEEESQGWGDTMAEVLSLLAREANSNED
jgi:hypothetical protein